MHFLDAMQEEVNIIIIGVAGSSVDAQDDVPDEKPWNSCYSYQLYHPKHLYNYIGCRTYLAVICQKSNL